MPQQNPSFNNGDTSSVSTTARNQQALSEGVTANHTSNHKAVPGKEECIDPIETRQHHNEYEVTDKCDPTINDQTTRNRSTTDDANDAFNRYAAAKEPEDAGHRNGKEQEKPASKPHATKELEDAGQRNGNRQENPATKPHATKELEDTVSARNL